MDSDTLREIRARCDAATPGPWERGNWWHIQGASHCTCDERNGPLVYEGRMAINGRMMPAHVHRRPTPIWEYGITTATLDKNGWPTDVAVESDEYGVMTDADAKFIAHARSDVPALLDYIEQLEERAAEQRARILDFIDEVEQLEVALQLRAALLRDMQRVEYGVARPASMPDMSGRETWTLIVGATFRSLDDAETAQRNVPALRDAVIVQRRAPGDWERAREGSI